MISACRVGAVLILVGTVFPAVLSAAEGAAQVRVSALQVSRPAGEDPYQVPGMTITLEASVMDAPLLGVASGSAVESLQFGIGL